MKTELMNTKTVRKDVLYPELSYQVMQAVFEVHNQLGPGFTEDIYEAALVLELEAQGIAFERQKPIQVDYKGHYIGTYRLDMVIDEKIIIELKAMSALNDLHKAQLRSYLFATDYQLGILINFGSDRIQAARILNTRLKNS